MQRPVFERSVVDGFKSAKTESISMTSLGKRMFVGTSDGSLVLYDCRPDSVGNRGYSCSVLDIIRKQSKEKKAISSLMIIEQWRTCIGIMDGLITVYDSQFCQQLSSIPESKGCHIFAVCDRNNTLVTVVKKKLCHYNWHPSGFSLRRDFSLVDIPKNICCVGGSVILGYKKFYECLDLTTGITSRVLDVEKECKMVMLELPKSPFRADSMLLSLGVQGVLLDSSRLISGASFAYGSANEERLEWNSQPNAIHDVVSLHSLQRIQIASPSPHSLSFCSCRIEISSTSSSSAAAANKSAEAQPSSTQCIFVCNGEQLSVLRMISISSQVSTLVSGGLFEEAINLCMACAHEDFVSGVNMTTLYEQCANSLLLKGDFEKAVTNYIHAGTDFVTVVRQFPDLVPLPLHSVLNINSQTSKRLTNQVLHRAASALVQYCVFYRSKFNKRADRAEMLLESGIGGSTNMAAFRALAISSGKEDDDEDYIGDTDEEIRRAQLLDTVLLSALVACFPSRRVAVVELLSSPNRCQIESCSVLLASQGNSYTEALLWLFRSQNQHSRVLQALTEDKCVGVGAWTKDQFYMWTSEYLRWLWYHEEDITLPKQALFALKPLLEYDAELGLSVLISRPPNKSSFGGKGVTISEVLQFLRTVLPKTNNVKNAFGTNASSSTNKTARASLQTESRSAIFGANTGIIGVVSSTPLVNGHALGVAFLECLVSSGEAPPSMHDEFVQLLVEGLPFDNELQVNHTLNDLDVRDTDKEALMLYKIYRRKLQNFLLNSNDYNPRRVLKILPHQYLHENALVLSRLGKHKDVLTIYLHSLQSIAIAESYCERIFKAVNDTRVSMSSAATGDSQQMRPDTKASFASTGSSFSGSGLLPQLLDSGEIYLIMFRVILETSTLNPSSDDAATTIEEVLLTGEQQLRKNLDTVMRLAEKYFDRFDAGALLEMLPPATPLVTLSHFLKVVMEYSNTRKRNLKIVHQLLRIREVNIRTAEAVTANADQRDR